MKSLVFLFSMVFVVSILSAQEQSPIPKISQQISTYFSYYPREKVFITTDKQLYKPGETIWFRSFVSNGDNLLSSEEGSKIYVGLYDKMGSALKKDVYKLEAGTAFGDIAIPDKLDDNNYFLVAYTSVQSSQDQIAIIPLKIEPQYSNQWIVDAVVKDSVSISGKPNELFVILRDFSGEMQKNELLRFEIRNGSEVIAKDKVKTDDAGKATISFTIPNKTNGEPFICRLTDTKEEWSHDIFLPTSLDPVVIQFFPEGGNLIAGVPTRIGFTAFNKWGIPVNIEGSLVNAQGEKVAPVKTVSKGLGMFSTSIPALQQYKFVVAGTEGQNQSFDLPMPLKDGLALSVTKTDAEFIYSNMTFSDGQKHPVALTVTHGNNVYWAADMEINGTGRLKIPVEKLSRGINLLSVYSKEGNLLANRIVYKDNAQKLKIAIQPGQTSLHPGEKMRAKALLTNENDQPVAGNISVSVSDKFRNEDPVRRIADYLMIESELETPFSLIPKSFRDKVGNSAFTDVFLIANKLKGFNWENISKFKPGNASISNVENFKISGFVTDKGGAKVNKAKVILAEEKTGKKYTATTNAEGIFLFPDLKMGDLNKFTAKILDSEGKTGLNINLIKNLEGQIAVNIAEDIQKYNLLNKERVADGAYFSNNEWLFSKAPKVLKANTQSLDNQRRMFASASSILDVIKTIKQYKIVNNQIVFMGSENSLNYQGGALIVLDGQQLGTDISAISNISPADVDHINVSTNPMDIQRYTGLNSVGVIEIFQKKAKTTEVAPTKSSSDKYSGEFRVPTPFVSEIGNLKKDSRTTLVWIPEQKVDASGQFEFTVPAGRVLSDFVIEVQGITPEGVMGTGISTFSVVK
jgi:Large extracellular alpha-helical protein